jgi:hypothetical protein
VKYGKKFFLYKKATFKIASVATLKLTIATRGKWRQGWTTLNENPLYKLNFNPFDACILFELK